MKSIRELKEASAVSRAENIRFPAWCQTAKKLYAQAKVCYDKGLFEAAYVFYLKYANITVEILPHHKDFCLYKGSDSYAQLKSCFDEVIEAIKKLEAMISAQTGRSSQPCSTETKDTRSGMDGQKETGLWDDYPQNHIDERRSSTTKPFSLPRFLSQFSGSTISAEDVVKIIDYEMDHASLNLNPILFIDVRKQADVLYYANQPLTRIDLKFFSVKNKELVVTTSSQVLDVLKGEKETCDLEIEYFQSRHVYELIVVLFEDEDSFNQEVFSHMANVIYNMEFDNIPKRSPVALKGGMKALISAAALQENKKIVIRKEDWTLKTANSMHKRRSSIGINTSSRDGDLLDRKTSLSYPKLEDASECAPDLELPSLASSFASKLSLTKTFDDTNNKRTSAHHRLYPDAKRVIEESLYSLPVLKPKPLMKRDGMLIKSFTLPKPARPAPPLPTHPPPFTGARTRESTSTGENANATGSPFQSILFSRLPLSGSTSGVMGLRNLGNTCFMNAVLQCIFAASPLTRYFLSGTFKAHMNHTNHLGTRGNLALAYDQLLRVLWFGEFPTYAPVDFRAAVCAFAARFSGDDQQDAQEFLSFFLDGIHEDLKIGLSNSRHERSAFPSAFASKNSLSDAERADLEWQRYLSLHYSVIVHLFQGQLRSSIECQVCHCQSNTFNEFMYLSLPVQKSRSTLTWALETYLKTEMLTEDNAWLCPQCQRKVRASKKLDLWRLPELLIIHFKRFSYEGPFRDKIESIVDAPVQGLDLTPYIEHHHALRNASAIYDLFAVTNHYGTIHGGHYKATTFIEPRQAWFAFDDSRASPVVEPSQMIEKAAYILFYKRR